MLHCSMRHALLCSTRVGGISLTVKALVAAMHYALQAGVSATRAVVVLGPSLTCNGIHNVLAAQWIELLHAWQACTHTHTATQRGVGVHQSWCRLAHKTCCRRQGAAPFVGQSNAGRSQAKAQAVAWLASPGCCLTLDSAGTDSVPRHQPKQCVKNRLQAPMCKHGTKGAV